MAVINAFRLFGRFRPDLKGANLAGANLVINAFRLFGRFRPDATDENGDIAAAS